MCSTRSPDRPLLGAALGVTLAICSALSLAPGVAQALSCARLGPAQALVTAPAGTQALRGRILAIDGTRATLRTNGGATRRLTLERHRVARRQGGLPPLDRDLLVLVAPGDVLHLHPCNATVFEAGGPQAAAIRRIPVTRD